MKQFTAQQLKDWNACERVRKRGEHNMYFPGARRDTKLNQERYSFVMENYSELKEAIEQTHNEHKPTNT